MTTTETTIMQTLTMNLQNASDSAELYGVKQMAIVLKTWVDIELTNPHLGDTEMSFNLASLSAETKALIEACEQRVPVMDTVREHVRTCSARLETLAHVWHPLHSDPWLLLAARIISND